MPVSPARDASPGVPSSSFEAHILRENGLDVRIKLESLLEKSPSTSSYTRRVDGRLSQTLSEPAERTVPSGSRDLEPEQLGELTALDL